MGASLVVFFLPVVLNEEPWYSITVMIALAITMYIGFALGVLRYRLFELERWRFVAWLWFFGGLAILLVDVALAWFFGLNPVHALGIAVIAAGWVYSPLRQWLWAKLGGAVDVRMETYLPEFVQALFTCPSATVDELWRDLLKRIFQPLAVEPYAAGVSRAELADNGARLLVPSLADTRGAGMCLLYGQGGRRLFSKNDLNIVNALAAVAERVCGVREAQEKGARLERKRIMRDLHDDVGGRILALLHTAEAPRQAELARKALRALRESINALDDEQVHHLPDLFDDWRDELHERLTPLAIRLCNPFSVNFRSGGHDVGVTG
ncbi:histidine kinase dimerization/phosphoacceptor domain-containing protein [Ectothiorhodospira sp. PHS-1]|uniref:histidine kinase dimerization/phosphoacceptor domain-containing protein n=1 Tax=Ectothiorhodospira sp. PHS-1 TaxID=519989 RepID=UPI0002E34607|nr:histidine kinase dimerization/phosphoacceptor domain-containing protein [Ectothiorhodospira sp. PHS-1]